MCYELTKSNNVENNFYLALFRFRSLRKNMITKLDNGVLSGLTNLQYLYVLHKILRYFVIDRL